jgi:hypothetical protein
MSIIDNLITDRAESDVIRWRTLRNKGFAAMTPDERAEWMQPMKGSYGATDLNRVGEAMLYLLDLVGRLGIYMPLDIKTDWQDGDIPSPAQLEVYITNINTLRTAVAGLPGVPDSHNNLDYIGANEIEQMFVVMEIVIGHIMAAFRHSGVTISGFGGLIL